MKGRFGFVVYRFLESPIRKYRRSSFHGSRVELGLPSREIAWLRVYRKAIVPPLLWCRYFCDFYKADSQQVSCKVYLVQIPYGMARAKSWVL